MKHKGRVEGYPFAFWTIVTLLVFILSLFLLWRPPGTGLGRGIGMILTFSFITLPSSQMLFVMFFATYLEKFKFSLRPSLFFSCLILAPILFGISGFFAVLITEVFPRLASQQAQILAIVVTWLMGVILAISYLGILGKIYANKTVPKKVILATIFIFFALFSIIYLILKL